MLATLTPSNTTSAMATRPSHRRTTRAELPGLFEVSTEPGAVAFVLGAEMNVDSDI